MSEISNSLTGVAATGFSLLQNLPDYFVVMATDWSMVHANPSFQARLCPAGLPAAAKFHDFLDTPSKQRVVNMDAFFTEARRIDLNHRTADGATITVHYCFYPLRSEEYGRPLLAGIGRDRAGDLATLLEVIQLNLELGHREKQLEEANARLELLSHTDQLTQLYNRHYFFQVAQHFWEEARRYKLPLTLMMMDLDEFKNINDQNGHLFGDYVLQQSSVRLKGNTRKSDILARYGGEEFVLLASNTDLQTGLVLGERLRMAAGSEPYVMGNVSASVTISIGISGTELDDFQSFEQLLDSSDKALYAAKAAGRNRVVQYSPGLAGRPPE
jgi:diguanylate cyclase (GGDEF)-like protein